MANKIYIADAYYDGRFGTQYGEVAQEPRQIKATSLPQAFKKAFGFLPSERVKPNTGYRGGSAPRMGPLTTPGPRQ